MTPRHHAPTVLPIVVLATDALAVEAAPVAVRPARPTRLGALAVDAGRVWKALQHAPREYHVRREGPSPIAVARICLPSGAVVDLQHVLGGRTVELWAVDRDTAQADHNAIVDELAALLARIGVTAVRARDGR